MVLCSVIRLLLFVSDIILKVLFKNRCDEVQFAFSKIRIEIYYEQMEAKLKGGCVDSEDTKFSKMRGVSGVKARR